MAWPLSQDYNEAIQSPASSFSDAELKTGEVVTNALGLPMPRSGNFADVYEFKCPQRKWAIKCFTREIPGIRERYKEISAYLKQSPLPFMVDFSYLEQGIRIRGEWFPVLKMQWVEGFTLNDFVRQQIEKPQLLDVLCQIWVKLAARLRDANMAHCDLQHGNVLMVPGSKASSLAIKLVDYDGMCVPALTLLKSIEVGHPNFQHPQRAREGIYSLEVDRFCHLVIYTALRALIAGGKPLWEKFDNGDNLLFKQTDLEDPSKSPVFQELARSSDPAVKTLVETLTDAIKKPLDQAPLLPELAAKLPASTIATAVTKSVSAPAPQMQTAESLFASATAPGEPKLRKKAGGSKTPMLIAAGVGGLLVLGGIVGAIAFMGGGNKPDEPGKNDAIIAQGDKDKVEPKGPVENPKEPVKNKDPEPRPDPRPDPKPDPKPDPVVRAPGEPKSLRFKGKDNVELANTRDLLDMNGKFTIEMWLKLPDNNQTQHIIGDLARQPEGGRFGGWAMHANRRGPSWHLQTEFSTQGPGWTLGLGVINPSEWHHVAIVNLGDNTQVFVDGKPAAPPLGARRQRLNSPINIYLGIPKELPYQNRTFDGELRGLRISSTSRYTEPFKPEPEFAKDADTLVLLDFASGEGKKIADLSGSNHNGTIVGAEWIAKEAVAVRPETKESPTLRFKGKGNVELADTAGMVDPNGVFTFETWLKLPADKEQTQYIAGDLVSDGDSPDKGRGGWSITANTKNMGQEWDLHVRFGADNGQVWNLHTGATLKPGRWYHAAIVKSEKLQLFVDGRGGGSPSPLRFLKSPLNISLGVPREVTRKPYAFDGELRDVRISSNARYGAENFVPEQHFTKDADTLVLLGIASGQGDKVPDLSGNKHHGILDGVEWNGKTVVAVGATPVGQGKVMTNSIGMKLALIPAGEFRMGSPAAEPGVERYPSQGPQHRVKITKPFYMGVHEVKQSEFEMVGVRPPLPFTFKDPDNPAENIDWATAAEFCRKLSELPEEKKAGRVYRLPTEAEWEYACRAGTTTVFHYGDVLSKKQATFNGKHAAGDKTTKVGSYEPNAWGLYDMHGNVWEWCWDGPRNYTAARVEDPKGPEDAGGARVLRGGAWNTDEFHLRAALRFSVAPQARGENVGLRVVLVEWIGKDAVAVRPDPKPDPVPVVEAGKPLVITKESRRIDGHTQAVRSLAVTADGKRVLTASYDQTVRMWDLENGKELARLLGHTTPVQTLAMTPDGTRAVSGAGSSRVVNNQVEYGDTTLRVWDLEKKQEIATYDGHKVNVRALAISPDKKLVASCAFSNPPTVKIWNLETGEEVRSVMRQSMANALAFTSDPNRLLVAEGNSVVLLDVKAGREVRRIEHSSNVHCLAVSPDGKRVLYGAGNNNYKDGNRMPDGSAVIRNVEDGRDVVQLPHTYPVQSVAIGPDGRYALTASGGYERVENNRTEARENYVRLWDLESGKEIARLEGHAQQISSLGLTADGKVISAAFDSTRIWQLPKPGELTAKVVEPKPDPMPAVKPPEAPAKAAVPAAAAQKEAEAALLEEFKDDLAKTKTAAEQSAVAAKLLAAVNPKRKAEERFVLAKLARDLAAKAGDPTGVIKAIDTTARDFDIDAAAMKLEALKAMPIASPTAGRNLAEACLTLVDEALADDEFDFALYLIPIAEPAAKKANNISLSKRVEARGKRIKELQQEFEQVKAAFATLEKTPDDPAASLAAGKYLCLSKGNWDKGLPLLENCNDQALKALAKREKRQASDPDDQTAIGDAYWDLSLKDAGPGKQQLMRRAYHWYDQAVVGLSGATLVRIEKRMKQATDLMPDLKPPEAVGLIRTFDGHSDEVRCVALSRDGRRGLSGCSDGSVRVWDIHNGKELHRFDRISNDVRTIMFSSDGRRAIVGTSNGLSTLDLERKRIDRGMGFGGVGGGLDFLLLTTDSQVLFSRGGMLWQIGEDMTNTRGKSLGRNFACVASSLDGRIMATGSADGVVQVYAISDTKNVPTRQFTAAQGPLGAIAMSPDGRYLATAGAGDRLVRVWDTATGKIRTTFKGHAARVHAIAFSRDGKRILSGGEDRTARLWDLTGKELSKLEGHTGEVLGVALSLDGRRALTASGDKSVRVWGLPR